MLLNPNAEERAAMEAKHILEEEEKRAEKKAKKEAKDAPKSGSDKKLNKKRPLPMVDNELPIKIVKQTCVI